MYDASTSSFVLANYDNGGWAKWDGSEWTPITATASDVLVAIAGVSKTGVTVTSLAASASFFEGVQFGYRSGDISFETSSVQKTCQNYLCPKIGRRAGVIWAMPRRLRPIADGLVYHVINRGNYRHGPLFPLNKPHPNRASCRFLRRQRAVAAISH